MPSFQSAVDKFKAFLKEGGHSDDLVWIFREDIVPTQWELAVRVPIPVENPIIAERQYDTACERGLGVELLAVAALGEKVACHIWAPADEIDAQYHLLSGLKLSVRTPLPRGLEIRGRFAWSFRKWRSRKAKVHWSEVPRRN